MSEQLKQSQFTQAVGNADEINELLRRYPQSYEKYRNVER